MNFADTVRYLYSLGHELKTGKWDLANMRALLAQMGHPERHGRFIHVAGTNGKGSTCAMIASALRVSGKRTGLYTSPHLVDPRERIQIDGAWIDETDWCRAFMEVHAASERLLAREAIPAHPSFFETVTAMAFSAFAQAGVEMTVLETGLGGRLDATNVVTPEVTVITQVDFDHEALLGSGIELIAAEKAGILKAGCPAVFSEQRPEALRVLEAKAAAAGALIAPKWCIENLHVNRHGSRFEMCECRECGVGFSPRLSIHCPLPGKHQVENAKTAAAALTIAGVSPQSIQQGISQTTWPGRLEYIGQNPDLILDGAHNPAGAQALAEYIQEFFRDEPVRIIFGAMRDKAIDEVTETLFPLASEVIVTAPDQPRALNPEALIAACEHSNISTASTLKDALAMCAGRDMTTFITGSLYLVGEARGIYGTQPIHG